ncbi:membrane-associated protein, putative [Bodo saltans]|uniref:Membrane-associated protein, putative n=1 Tax=Bodo saltans TaxID=75058 RepID=A0A0S4KFB1_BODSA|nr:membrane-associated protein, putative [Bodo saltans]|eukprot:CUI14333.1 membrane-associated protein, putative [Bodo saltans]
MTHSASLPSHSCSSTTMSLSAGSAPTSTCGTRSAYLGMFIALTVVTAVVVICPREAPPGLFLSISMYSSLVLTVLAIPSASINLLVQEKFHSPMQTVNHDHNGGAKKLLNTGTPHQLILQDMGHRITCSCGGKCQRCFSSFCRSCTLAYVCCSKRIGLPWHNGPCG